jgi:adenylate cyclase
MSGETPESGEGPAATGPPTTSPPTIVQDPPSGIDDGAPHASGHVHAHHPTIRFRFLEQLKHRNIIRVAILYLVACWLILAPVHVVFHMLEVPAWANRLVVILMIIGFPVVLLFAWVYEITPEGLKPTIEVDPHRSIRKLTGQRLDRAIMVLLVLGIAYLLADKFWLSKHVAAVEIAARAAGEHGTETGAQKIATAAPAPPAASVAVLAFSDLSADRNQGYFSDGIAEEILSVLAHVNGLKVASRTSSFQFRKSDLGAPAIAQKLGVRHILEGSVRRAGDTVRITAQLIDASTDQHEWSQSFDRPLSTANLFAIQDEIAKNIVDHLAATMGSAADVAGPVARKADTANEDAYDLYLKGRSIFIARTKDNLAEAARILNLAVAKDPKFARAWEMLGAVLVTWKYWDVGDESDHQAGVDAVETALRLDPNLSLAYAVRGEVQADMIPSRGAVGWEDASESLSRAIEHDGKNATAFAWRAMDYAALGYFDLAIQDYQRCLDIDPAYELCRLHLAVAYLYLGRTDDALRFYEMGLENGDTRHHAAFAPAAAARGDRLGALSTLALQFRDDPQLIRPLFRALTDPTFGDRDRQDALALVNRAKNTRNFIPTALWMLKAYDKIIADNYDPPIWWAREDAAWLKSQSRKQAIQHWHLPEYWRKHGFPPQCRPVGESDFECR